VLAHLPGDSFKKCQTLKHIKNMKNSNESNTEKAIIVDGVVLTKKAIERLIALQNHDNEMLDDCSRVMADAVCAIVKNIDDFDKDELPRINSLLQDIAIVRANFNDLAKP
jgi:hypothetical protein